MPRICCLNPALLHYDCIDTSFALVAESLFDCGIRPCLQRLSPAALQAIAGTAQARDTSGRADDADELPTPLGLMTAVLKGVATRILVQVCNCPLC